MSEERPIGGLGTLGVAGVGHTCCQCGATLGIGESTCCKCGFTLGAGFGGHFGAGVAGIGTGGCSCGTLGAFDSLPPDFFKKLFAKCNLCNCLDPATAGAVTIGTKGGFIISGDVDDILCNCTVIKLEDVVITAPGVPPGQVTEFDGPLFICCEDIIWLVREAFPVKGDKK